MVNRPQQSDLRLGLPSGGTFCLCTVGRGHAILPAAKWCHSGGHHRFPFLTLGGCFGGTPLPGAIGIGPLWGIIGMG